MTTRPLLKMHSRIFRSKGVNQYIYGLPCNIFHKNYNFSSIMKKRINKDHTTTNVEENYSVKKLLEDSMVLEEGQIKSGSTDKNKRNKKAVLTEPSNKSVILFPGQGTQFVGMGKQLLGYPNVKEMYERASEILEYDLLKLCTDGPDNNLTQTKYQQPAIFVTSLAAVEKLRHEQSSLLEACKATAGFSIGEITALTFAGCFSFEDAVKLVKIRGEAMQIASELTRSGMMAVFFNPDSRLNFACSVAKEYCQKIGLEDVDCRVANYLYPHCKVIAGNEEALEFIQKNKEDFRLKKLKRINVSGAFHTDLMKPAAYTFKEALQVMLVGNSDIPVISNYNGLPYTDVANIRHQLPKQIYSPVKWEQTLHYLYEKVGDGYPQTFECGPGKSLSSILKMVNLQAWNFCVNVDV